MHYLNQSESEKHISAFLLDPSFSHSPLIIKRYSFCLSGKIIAVFCVLYCFFMGFMHLYKAYSAQDQSFELTVKSCHIYL